MTEYVEMDKMRARGGCSERVRWRKIERKKADKDGEGNLMSTPSSSSVLSIAEAKD